MIILRATSILRGQKKDKGVICSITHFYMSVESNIIWDIGLFGKLQCRTE
jgi:hypothetical protein